MAPRENFVGNVGSLDSLRPIKQPMQTMYETINVPEPSDTRLLKATVLPMLMNERRTEKATDTRTEFTGTSRLGWTYLRINDGDRLDADLHHLPVKARQRMGVPHRARRRTFAWKPRP